jgi:hypothetical protein
MHLLIYMYISLAPIDLQGHGLWRSAGVTDEDNYITRCEQSFRVVDGFMEWKRDIVTSCKV